MTSISVRCHQDKRLHGNKSTHARTNWEAFCAYTTLVLTCIAFHRLQAEKETAFKTYAQTQVDILKDNIHRTHTKLFVNECCTHSIMEITLHVMCVVFSVELFVTFFFLECIWRYINILWSEGIFSCKLIGFEPCTCVCLLLYCTTVFEGSGFLFHSHY